MKNILTLVRVAVPVVSLCVAGCATAQTKDGGGVQLSKLSDRVKVEVNGKLFTEYVFANTPRPYCYPLLGPGQLEMMRHAPMKKVPGEDQDHPHHRSLWFTHGEVNGVDF